MLLMAPPQGEDGGGMSTMLFLGAIFLIMYFFMIRPQTKKAKDQKKFIQDLNKGDKIVTAGGIHGKILKVGETTLLIEVDANTKLKIEKSVVSLDLTKALADEKS